MHQCLRHLRKVVRYLRKDVYEDMPIRHLDVLLFVCEKGEVSLSQIAEGLDMGKSTASHAVKILSTYQDREKGKVVTKGANLLCVEQDPFERRRIIIKLTPLGLAALQGIVDILQVHES